MAASVQTTATSLEGQLWELAVRGQIAELAVPEETRPNNLQTTIDTENGTVAITFTCPAEFTVGDAGQMVAAPTPYLP